MYQFCRYDGLMPVPQRTFWICLTAYTFSQLDLALFGYALPAIRAEFDVSLSAMGAVISASFGLGGIVLVALGSIADRRGRKPVMVFSIVSSSTFIALHGLATGLLSLTTLRGLSIATGGVLYPVTGAIMAEEAPAKYRGLYTGLLQCGYPLGWFAASLLAAPLLTNFGWRPVFLVGLISIPFVWVVVRYLREPPRYVVQKASLTAERPGIATLFAPEYRERTLVLFAAQFLFVMAYGGSAFWFPTFFIEARGMDIGNSALLVGLGNGVGTLGYIGAALVGEFVLTRRSTVVIWTSLGAVSFLCLIWLTETPAQATVVFAIMSMFFYGTAAVKFAFVAEIFPTSLRATGLSVCGSLAVSLGVAVGPLLVSLLAERYGWDVAFTSVCAVPLVLAGLLYLRLRPVASGIELEDIPSPTQATAR